MENPFFYKYKNIHSSTYDWIEAIIDGNLYTPSLKQLNDPFESLFDIVDIDLMKHLARHYGVLDTQGVFKSMTTDEKVDAAFLSALFSREEVLKIIREGQIAPYIDRARIQCLSARKNSISMWTYYANEFKGLLFEYSADEIKNGIKAATEDIDLIDSIHGPTQMRYDDNRLFPMKKLNQETMIQNIFSKFSDWAHEEEYRIIVILKKETSSFSLPLKPNRIFYGFNVDKKDLNWLQTAAASRSIPIEEMSKEKIKTLMQQDAASRSVRQLANLKALGDIKKRCPQVTSAKSWIGNLFYLFVRR